MDLWNMAPPCVNTSRGDQAVSRGDDVGESAILINKRDLPNLLPQLRPTRSRYSWLYARPSSQRDA